jgi:hypothetical protein
METESSLQNVASNKSRTIDNGQKAIVLIGYHHELLDLVVYLCLFTIKVVYRINKRYCAHYQCGCAIVILKLVPVDILFLKRLQCHEGCLIL